MKKTTYTKKTKEPKKTKVQKEIEDELDKFQKPNT